MVFITLIFNLKRVASFLHFVVEWEDMANHISFLKRTVITLVALMAAAYKEVSEKLQ